MIRRLLRPFIARIHPDAIVVPAAIPINTLALQELNAYVDKLEAESDSAAPVIGKSYRLFVRRSNGRLRPWTLDLPGIPPEADFLERREIGASLVRQVAALLEAVDASIQHPLAAKVAPLLSQPREDWKTLVRREDQREQTHRLLYETETLPDKRESYRKFLQVKLTLKYSKIKHTLTRKIKTQQVPKIVEEILSKRLDRDRSPLETAEAVTDTSKAHKQQCRLAKHGYNPNFVFFARGLSASDRASGLANLAGETLTEEADVWLLENIFRVLREVEPSIPLVIGSKYGKSSEFGFLEIPWNFRLAQLAGFVDENIDQTRAQRQAALQLQRGSSRQP